MRAVIASRRSPGHTQAQAQAAAVVGVGARAWQRWESYQRVIPYAHWRLYLLETDALRRERAAALAAAADVGAASRDPDATR